MKSTIVLVVAACMAAISASAMTQEEWHAMWNSQINSVAMQAEAVARIEEVSPPFSADFVNLVGQMLLAYQHNAQGLYDYSVSNGMCNFYGGSAAGALGKTLAQAKQDLGEGVDGDLEMGYVVGKYNATTNVDSSALTLAVNKKYAHSGWSVFTRLEVYYPVIVVDNSVLLNILNNPRAIVTADDAVNARKAFSRLDRKAMSVADYTALLQKLIVVTDVSTNTSDWVGFLKSNLEVAK